MSNFHNFVSKRFDFMLDNLRDSDVQSLICQELNKVS